MPEPTPPPADTRELTCQVCGRSVTVGAHLANSRILCKGCGEPLLNDDAMVRSTGRSNLPRATPATLKEPAPAARSRADTVIAVTAIVVAAGLVAAFALRGREPERPGAAPPAPAAQHLAHYVQAFARDAFTAPHARARIERYAALALLGLPDSTTARRPNAPAQPAVEVLAVRTLAVPERLAVQGVRTLVFVAYRTTGVADVPTTRGAETALARTAPDADAFPHDAVLLVRWTGAGADARARLYAIDFVSTPVFGIAVAALDPNAPAYEGEAVAFALGDPIGGAGHLISDWAPVPAGGASS